MTKITGGCLCGAVRYVATMEPIAVRQCWCRLCQYIGGGSATVNCGFRTHSISITGELRTFSSVADSGNTMRRSFCPVCGTPVTSAADARPHLVFLRAGTLDDPSIAKPQMTIWTEKAPDWACIDPAIPRIGGQPPPAA